MLDPDDIPSLVSRMWLLHTNELNRFDNIHEHVEGRRGRPEIPDDADREVKGIWDICVHNVLTLVIDAFVQNLSAVGYRDGAAEQNAVGWAFWQANQMDARQAEIYTSAVKYGTAYVVVEPGDTHPVMRIRSPRQILTVYADPHVDQWPQLALETWIDETDAKPRRKGLLIDDEYTYPLDMGEVVASVRNNDDTVKRIAMSISSNGLGTPIPHKATANGKPVCPVVRYINNRDSESLVGGEIERLINDQRAINEVNFDRLIVARFGAFPQKVISGWTGTKNEVLQASARKFLTFDDEVKAYTLAAASVAPYNEVLEELIDHVASRAQVSPGYVTGKNMSNLSADALAAAEANQQRKLASMRDSFGESHEQMLELAAEMGADDGTEVDVQAEVVWRDTEARSFGIMADGIFKLGTALQAGAPIGPLLPLVPGLTQQVVTALIAAGEKAQQLAAQQTQQSNVTGLVQNLQSAAKSAMENPTVSALAVQTRPPGQ